MDSIGIPIIGEGKSVIPEPGDGIWSKNALPSMAYGYNLQMTPLQTLTFYNAIANEGVMVKPRFIKEVRAYNQPIRQFDTEVMENEICSKETLDQIRDILKNIVKRGTGQSLYSEYFSMAGKTGTARVEYNQPDWAENPRYISSFAGYFPAENPKYSCIVVIHKPSTKKGYYGADVTGPVFKRIAQKIFTDSPRISKIGGVDEVDERISSDFENYYDRVQQTGSSVPDVSGMAGMDAVSLLENMGMRVEIKGNGTVSSQSIEPGAAFRKRQIIQLTLK